VSFLFFEDIIKEMKGKFKPVDPKPDFPSMERKILERWYQSGLVAKYLHKNDSSKKTFSFFDGPITANNPMGVHHAWGRTYKDLWQRYKNMQGCKQRFQNGFDCQGLWVEVEVEKDLGFNSKKDIEKFGLDNFAEACKKRVAKYSRVQTEQSKRLGYFMDWENSYYTFTDKNIEYIWYFLKQCFKKDWLNKGFRSLPWCARCGTSLSQHELTDSYKEMTHKSVYLKLPLVERKKEFFLVWTTTPWTLAANVALAVNPNLIYAKVKSGEEFLILAKDLLKVIKDKHEIVEEIKGSRLAGIKYRGPFDELPVQKKSQRIVLTWEEVSGTEGTGVVHIAPGCGEEDFDLGKKYQLAVLVPLDENGNYLEGYDDLTGKFAHKVEDEIFASLEKKGLLYRVEDYTHSYPICWRCKAPIVFRAEENWFISASKIRPRMKREAKKVKWHPEYVGKLMIDWLTNMRDWNISRKRYFGLPLPFYECKCSQVIIVGSKEELKKLAIEPNKVDKLPELHRPWIDEIKIKCPKCGGQVERIPDIGDCWLDAGIVPFSTLDYLSNKEYWRIWYPADWISEMREQVRLWFYSMLFMSVTLEDKTPYLEVLSYEKLYDERGAPMHKSAGNAIWFDDAAEKMGVDVMRWMYLMQKPELNLNFGYKVADETRRKFHLLLWNVYNFFVSYANIGKFQPLNFQSQIQKSKNVLDRWLISRLNNLVKVVTESLDRFDAFTASHQIQGFVEDLSTWYIRRSRDRVSPVGKNEQDQEICFRTLYSVLVTLAKLLAPFNPFMAEEICRNLTEKQSVHLEDWPKADEDLVDEVLEEKMRLVRKICEAGHAKRKELGIKVRQPLKRAKCKGQRAKLDEELVQLIKDELNVKAVIWEKEKIGEPKVEFDTKITQELKEEGEARELIRQIQEARKLAGCRLDEQIEVVAPSWPKKFEEEIKRETLTTGFTSGEKLKIRRRH
jgi:isoleucyl-tRNA synthetase